MGIFSYPINDEEEILALLAITAKKNPIDNEFSHALICIYRLIIDAVC